MKSIVGNLIIFVLVALFGVLTFGVGFILLSTVTLWVGRLLQRIVPTFSLFEATLLSLCFGLVTGYILRGLVRLFVPIELREQPLVDTLEQAKEAITAENYHTIPAERFYHSEAERTWEAWLRSELANDIYIEFQEKPNTLSNLNTVQIQDLAIRMADAGLNIIKRETGRAQRLKASLKDLQQELNEMGQRHYEDAVLRLALAAINMNMNFFGEKLREIIGTQRWNQPTTGAEQGQARERSFSERQFNERQQYE